MNEATEQVDVIYFTLFPWDNSYSSVSLSFTREFAKNHRVFYINPPFTAKDIITNFKEVRVNSRLKDQLKHRLRYERIPNFPSNVIAVHPPMVLPINWLSEGRMYNRLHDWNNKVIFKTIEEVIKKYNIKRYIYLNCFNPSVGAILPKSFAPLLNIYQCIDDMTQEAYTAKHWAKLEEKVISEADIVLVTSKKLQQLKKAFNPNTYVLHNAVDANIFRKALETKYDKPAELKNIRTPIIGFTGNMDGSRIDYELLKKIALIHQDKTLVLIGPTNTNDYLELGLDKMPNIIFTGSKDINELPKYLQHFDCAIIPFLCNKLTESIYPLKINEYLFSGKPVIATNFSDDIRTFQNVVYLATDHEDFLSLIDKAIQENNADLIQARVNVARSNTWTHRVKQFWEIVEHQLQPSVNNHELIR